VEAWGPQTWWLAYLALGLLTGKIGPERVFEGDDLRIADPRFSVENRGRAVAFAEAVQPVAAAHGASVAELVIAWTLRQPGITFALCGARNPEQAKENARRGRGGRCAGLGHCFFKPGRVRHRRGF